MNNKEMLRTLKFDGTSWMDFTWFKEKLLTVAGIKEGFDKAYLSSLPSVDANGISIHDNVKKNELAWNYLALTLEGTLLMMICRIGLKDPSIAWKTLVNRYEPTNLDTY